MESDTIVLLIIELGAEDYVSKLSSGRVVNARPRGGASIRTYKGEGHAPGIQDIEVYGAERRAHNVAG